MGTTTNKQDKKTAHIHGFCLDFLANQHVSALEVKSRRGSYKETTLMYHFEPKIVS